MKTCDKCGSRRVAHVSGKCSDRFHAELGPIKSDGYVDSRWGIDKGSIGGGKYIDIDLCMNCGKVQGPFPITDEQLMDTGE